MLENAPEKEPGRKKVIHDAINPKFDKSVKCQGPLFLEFNSKIKFGDQLINFRTMKKIGDII